MSKTKLREFEARQQQAITDSALLPCEISYLLYHADVLNTGCQQNSGMENEYDSWRAGSVKALLLMARCQQRLALR